MPPISRSLALTRRGRAARARRRPGGHQDRVRRPAGRQGQGDAAGLDRQRVLSRSVDPVNAGRQGRLQDRRPAQRDLRGQGRGPPGRSTRPIRRGPSPGGKDPAGADLWFNGQPGWFTDPAHVLPSGDKVVDGKTLDGSGIFQGQGAPPDYVVTFPKEGSYVYLCIDPPGHEGHGQGASASAPRRRRRPRTRGRGQAGQGDGGEGQAARDGGPHRERRPGRQRRAARSPSSRSSRRRATVPAGTPGASSRCRRTRRRSTTSCSARGVRRGARREVHRPGRRRASRTTRCRCTRPTRAPLTLRRRRTTATASLNTGLLDADARSPLPRSGAVTFSTAGQLRVHLHGARARR